MKTAVIIDAVRTPIGRAHKDKGYYRDVRSDDLAAVCLQALVERTGIDPAQIEDVIMGCVMQAGEQSNNIGRNAVMASKLPESVPATSIDRQCGSAQTAVSFPATSPASQPESAPASSSPASTPPPSEDAESVPPPSTAPTSEPASGGWQYSHVE